MPLKKFKFIRKITLPIACSIGIHSALLAALFYVTVNNAVNMPKQEAPVMSVTMINLATFAPPPKLEPQAQPEPEPEPEPELKPEPEPLHDAVPLPKPKPKPVKKAADKPKPTIKPVPKPVQKEQNKPDENQEASQSDSQEKALKTSSPASSSPEAADTNSGPQPLTRSKPQYPARAFALKVEGRVKVQFDVDSAGRVDNVRVLSAQPRNMFEREVKQAMRKWRYEPKAAKDLVVTLVFKIDSGSGLEE